MCANRSNVCTGKGCVTVHKAHGKITICLACADLLASKGLIRRELHDAATI